MPGLLRWAISFGRYRARSLARPREQSTRVECAVIAFPRHGHLAISRVARSLARRVALHNARDRTDLAEEVSPVCSWNLLSIAGEWAGFDLDWLRESILRQLDRPSWFSRLGRCRISLDLRGRVRGTNSILARSLRSRPASLTGVLIVAPLSYKTREGRPRLLRALSSYKHKPELNPSSCLCDIPHSVDANTPRR